MSDIIKKPDASLPGSGVVLNKGKLRSTSSPFQQRVNQTKRDEVDPATMPNRLTLMLDSSGSMQQPEYDKHKNTTQRIELLKQAVSVFIGRCNLNDTSIAIETFPEQIQLQLSSNPIVLDNILYNLRANGGTPMHACVVKCLGKIPMTRGVLVSDGEAGDWGYHAVDEEEYEENTGDTILTKYKNAGIPIDCVHISNSTSGEALLQRIAEMTGGIFIKFTDVSAFSTAFGYLAPGMRGLLANGTITAEQIGAKELKR